MLQVKSIQKFRDNNGVIIGYRLQDETGSMQDIESDKLKELIRYHQISVVNLSLTSDNRLIDNDKGELNDLSGSLGSLYGKTTIPMSKAEKMLIKMKAAGMKSIKLNTGCGHTVEITSDGLNTKSMILYIPDNVTFPDAIFINNGNLGRDLCSKDITLHVVGGEGIKYASRMFSHTTFQKIDLSKFEHGRINSLSRMFEFANIGYLDLIDFSTANVIDMSRMFYGATINYVNLHMDTQLVTDMSQMFARFKTNNLSLTYFETKKVVTMDEMFSECEAPEINLNNFDTSNVKNMAHMFAWSKAKKINVSTFTTDRCKVMTGMFMGVELPELDLDSMTIARGTEASNMFRYSNIGNIKSKDRKLSFLIQKHNDKFKN